jgi:septum formation protein
MDPNPPGSHPDPAPPIILASSSPRRAELLSRLGLSFEVLPPSVPEEGLEGESPAEHVERLSREKAHVVRQRRPDALVLAGDTVVVLGGSVLGKPVDEEDAVRMLLALSGRTHVVVSGLAVAPPGGPMRSGWAETEVVFRPFGEGYARQYVETGEPMDKAGAYGIQGLGSALVAGIRGDYHNVMGLPLPLLLDLLEEGGWSYGFRGLSLEGPFSE